MIKYKCPKCGATLESPSSMAGQNDQCPSCKHACKVPERKKRRRILVGSCIGAGLVLVIGLALVLAHAARGPRSGTVGTTKTQPAKSQPADTPKTTVKDIERLRRELELPKTQQDAPLSPEQLFERASPAVVYIVVRDGNFKPTGLGSGFFVDAKGLIVTNYHVIKGAEFVTARLSNGATLFVEGVVATDPDADLALLKVSGAGFAFLKIADGPLPKVGAAVYAIGNPRGLENTFSSGMVSGHREIKKGLTAIQVTTPISRGSSGGPLLNATGEVVGVTTAYLKGGQNLNFAIPVAAVRRLIQRQGKVRTLASAGGGRLRRAETEELDKAWEAIAKQDWRAASKILTRLRKLQPENRLVWDALGYLHRKLGNHEITIEHWRRLVDDSIRSSRKGRYYRASLYTGFCFSKDGRYSDAIKAFKRAIVHDPDRAEAYYMMATIYMLQSFKGGKEKYSEAVEAYKKAVALKPDADSYYGMGTAYQYLKNYSKASESFKMAITFKTPVVAAAYFEMGWSYEEVGKPAAALDAYQQSLRLEPAGRYAGAARDNIRRLGGVPGQGAKSRRAGPGP